MGQTRVPNQSNYLGIKNHLTKPAQRQAGLLRPQTTDTCQGGKQPRRMALSQSFFSRIVINSFIFLEQYCLSFSEIHFQSYSQQFFFRAQRRDRSKRQEKGHKKPREEAGGSFLCLLSGLQTGCVEIPATKRKPSEGEPPGAPQKWVSSGELKGEHTKRRVNIFFFLFFCGLVFLFSFIKNIS